MTALAPPFRRARRREAAGGTRFLLFPQFFEDMPPELITLDRPPGSIGPGPSDPSLFVVDARDKAVPYDPPDYAPPYAGPLLPPALPDADGHFDHIELGTPQFLAAHLYGSTRHTLDIWQRYLRRTVVWFQVREHPRIELIPLVQWRNAQSGPGFLETGVWPDETGELVPFALNFDVVAHESGHTILFSQLGVPPPELIAAPFLAFHESFSDLIGMIAGMHFENVLDRLLQQTNGNLYLHNIVNRLGETSAHTQIRLASNEATMADVAGLALQPDGSWFDPTGQGRNQHAIAEPLTGAIFDVLVELFQDRLVSAGLIPPELDPRGWTRAEIEESFAALQHSSGRALRAFRSGFDAAIRYSRDRVGAAMAHVILTQRPEHLSFGAVAARFIDGLLLQGESASLPAMLAHFQWRGIDPLPFLAFGRAPRLPSRRDVAAAPPRAAGRGVAADRCAGHHHYAFARSLMRHPHRAEPG